MRRAPSIPRRLTVRGMLALSAAVGVLCAISTVYSIGLLPPKLEHRHVTVAAATAHALVDGRQSLIGAPTASRFDYDGFTRMAALYGNLVASPPVSDRIARRMGIEPGRLGTRSRLTLPVQWAMRDPDLEQRANQLVSADRPYKLELQADPSRPVLTVIAQAPSLPEATKLADTSLAELRAYLREQPPGEGRDAHAVVVTPLGPARGGVINGKVVPQMVALMLLVGFGLTLGLLLAGREIRRGWRAARAPAAVTAGEPADDAAPARGDRLPAWLADGAAGEPGGAWPHTTRVMPWLVAGIIAMLWIVPFNAIQLSVSLPFDAKLDRLVLPILFGVWLLSLATGGPASPRLRFTLVHAGLAIFVAAASLSIATNVFSLNQTLEFDIAFKKLTLLLSYAMLFVIVASTVRRPEVPAFLRFSLGLAVLTALGVIWEYRFHYNVFYDLPHKLLPGIFTVAQASVDVRDDIGRVMTFGPTDHPLEITGMLTMALPIALVGILGTRERRHQVLYGIAACVLLAAAISTYRKSALLGPVSVVLVIAYFRRRELLRLAPLGLVSLVAIHVLSPGAFGSIVFQLHPDKLGVATVSDRAADYDAVRPDVWANLLFGRGYGSYDHLSYRILDSDMLSRLVDVGIVGLLAALFLPLSILLASRRMINARDPQWSGPMLAVGAAAVAFLVVGFLFDVTSFPHVPYILLTLAALAAVVAGDRDAPPAPAAAEPAYDAALQPMPMPVGARVPEPVGR